MSRIYNPIWSGGRRRKLRNNQTSAEHKLWMYLRKKQMGFKFRRQFGVGPYIVDFYSPEARLVIEVDGDSHLSDEAKTNDEERDAFLSSLFIRVIRFTNDEVHHDLESVLRRIACSMIPPYLPSHEGRLC